MFYDVKKNLISIATLVALILSFEVSAQLVSTTEQTVNTPYNFPWAGGIDAVQYCEVELNMDGIMDLLVFDRRGNRKMCFVNKGIPNEIDYEYAPQYAEYFPDLKNWVIFADYNMDGKNDIFTYWTPGTMMVYTNISDNILKFEKAVDPFLETLFPGGYVNLYVTDADYPGIADVDFDGDLDILTFGVLGSFVDMHKNMSMEKYGIPDSLDYEHYTYCWGHFAENDESNQLYLDTCFGEHLASRYPENERHVGSTFLVTDLDGNGLVDILLGDVDYPWLMALYNHGTIEDARITSIDTLYPVGDNYVELFSMPCPSYIDVNNDLVKDLIVSPFDPGIITSRSTFSSWLYLNEGTNNNPDFRFVEKQFLQKNMLDVGSGAYPVLFDWDNDGLEDLFIGNYGYYQYSYYTNYILHTVHHSKIAYFKNTGSQGNPEFQLWDRDFAGLSELKTQGMIPAFDDIDGDGLIDLLVGTKSGNIVFVRNSSEGGFEIVDENYGSIDVGNFSAPQLFDLDKDGLNDLIIGEKAGNINYYRNHGQFGLPDFQFVTDSLGKVLVTDYSVSLDGFSTPCFFRIYNETGLLVGSEQGKVFYYTNIDNNLTGSFDESENLDQLLDTSGVNYDRGMRTSAIIADLYQDGKLEMIVGNYSGGLEYINGQITVNTDINENYNCNELTIYPNPASDYIEIKLPEEGKEVGFKIIDLQGKIIDQFYYSNCSSVFNLDVSSLDTGNYLLETSFDNQKFINRLIINR